MEEVLLEVKNLIKHFPVTKGLIFSKIIGSLKAVDGIDFSIRKGETFGLVGESGCGKTTTSKLILMLEKISDGKILYNGKDISKFSPVDLKNYRRSVHAVFQNPYSSLSPRMRIKDIISEPIVINRTLPKKEIRDRVAEVLEVVGLGNKTASFYPHEFSGGQRQRVAVARALALNPNLIILDEPVSALDVSIRAQLANLLCDIQDQYGISYLLIAHDLAFVKHLSHRVGVMYLGKFVEMADSESLYSNPLHPYTKALYSAALPSFPNDNQEEIILHGEVPSPINPPSGCRFHPRCPEVKPLCREESPPLIDADENHYVACHQFVI